MYGRTSSIADSEQFLHAQMLLGAQSELKKLGSTRKVVLVDMLVVEGARIDLKELLTDTGALDADQFGEFDIMDSHILHLDLVSVVQS